MELSTDLTSRAMRAPLRGGPAVSGGGPGALIAAGAGVAGLVAGLAVAARDRARFEAGETWISQGGTPHGTLYGGWLGRRSVVKWAVANLLNPMRASWVVTTGKAESAARTWENELFYPGEKQFGTKIRIGYDNGPDAFRHTYGSAAIVYRLMRERGADAKQAIEFLRGAGNAHERDSWLHAFNAAHGRFSSDMDVHNNEVGVRIGAALAAQHAASGTSVEQGEALVRAAVLDAIGTGRTVVMDRIDSAPRSSTWADIAQVAPDGRTPLRDAAGAPRLRTHVPDAPGFPMPIANGTVDLSLPHAKLGPAQLAVPRDDVPQATPGVTVPRA